MVMTETLSETLPTKLDACCDGFRTGWRRE